jgi:hypothetical protein
MACAAGLFCSAAKSCEYLRGLTGDCDPSQAGCAPGLRCDPTARRCVGEPACAATAPLSDGGG